MANPVTFILANLADVSELSNIQVFSSGSSGTMASSGTALIANGAGAFTLNLPAAALVSPGQCVTVKKTETGAGAITVTPPTGTIDGAATATVSGGARSKSTFMWDGTNWWIVV
jgi:hypothetical protein